MKTQRNTLKKVLAIVVLVGVMLNGRAWSSDGSGEVGESGGFDLSWHSMDAGGGLGASGGGFELSGTAGQPDAGQLSGGGYALTGGFWAVSSSVEPAGPADCDGDGDVDLFDFEDFVGCTTGPTGHVEPECACFDLDGDQDVDLLDFEVFQAAFTG